jgi:hypothetical protein
MPLPRGIQILLRRKHVKISVFPLPVTGVSELEPAPLHIDRRLLDCGLL